MSLLKWITICGASATFAGCSIHPVPENVTGFNTHQIVQKIRCEMRDAIRAAIIKRLKQSDSDRDEAILLENDPTLFEKTRFGSIHDRLSPDARKIIGKYDSGGIGYEFTFNMIEVNNLSTKFGFGDTFKRGSLGFMVSSGSDRERDNK